MDSSTCRDRMVLAAELHDHASDIVGAARLRADTSAITHFLRANIAVFATANHAIRIELAELNGGEIMLGVPEGRAEVGIFADGTPALGLHLMPYRQDRLVLRVARPSAREAPQPAL